MNDAEKKFKQQGTYCMKANVPFLFWEEWEKDCKENYNNNYHAKLEHDHKYFKDMQVFIDSIIVDMISQKEEVSQLRAELEQLKSKSVETTSKPQLKTMGSNL